MIDRESKKRRLNLEWLAVAVMAVLFVASALAQGEHSVPTDTSIGEWNPVTRTYTLTTDVYESIVIDEDNLTLDGAGHTVTHESGGGPGFTSASSAAA